MTHAVALLGAGGKMGLRVTKKLVDAGYDVRAVETADVGKARLAEADIQAVDQATGIAGADVIVLALPDNIIGKVSRDIMPSLKSGALLIILDAAAPYAGDVPTERDDISIVIGHPVTHPYSMMKPNGMPGGIITAASRANPSFAPS